MSIPKEMTERMSLSQLPHVAEVLKALSKAISNPPVQIKLYDGTELEGYLIELYRGDKCLNATIEIACRIPE